MASNIWHLVEELCNWVRFLLECWRLHIYFFLLDVLSLWENYVIKILTKWWQYLESLVIISYTGEDRLKVYSVDLLFQHFYSALIEEIPCHLSTRIITESLLEYHTKIACEVRYFCQLIIFLMYDVHVYSNRSIVFVVRLKFSTSTPSFSFSTKRRTSL